MIQIEAARFCCDVDDQLFVNRSKGKGIAINKYKEQVSRFSHLLQEY
jgi:hypothetical protein